MDLVFGLSLTSTAVRWVLVEGKTGEGAPIDRGEFRVGAVDAEFLLDVLLNRVIVAENQVHAVGVTWSNEAAVSAGAVLDALADRGVRNVVVVPDTEAAGALAFGIAEVTDHDDVAVCVVEPDVALVALVNARGVTVERIDRPLDRDDALELTSSVIASLDVNDRRPDAVFVVGSDDVEVIVSSFEAISETPVFSAAEADLALASARQVNDAEVPAILVAPGVTSRIGVLSAVLGAAVLTFVVSLSMALGLRTTPDSVTEEPQNVNAAAPVAVLPPPRPTVSPQQAAAAMAQTLVARPPAPAAAPVYQPPAAAPVYQPAPAYVPPAPAFVPPPPPLYVPPPQQPRLRDRIIERIPIINRFHEPQPG
jgi:hypothetical protein